MKESRICILSSSAGAYSTKAVAWFRELRLDTIEMFKHSKNNNENKNNKTQRSSPLD
jgi:hypothetical protein